MPVQTMSILETPERGAAPIMKGARCPECGNHALILKDGCDFCSACGYVGVCGGVRVGIEKGIPLKLCMKGKRETPRRGQG